MVTGETEKKCLTSVLLSSGMLLQFHIKLVQKHQSKTEIVLQIMNYNTLSFMF